MKARETVMGNKKLQLLGQQYEDESPTCDLNHYLLNAQAEITAKVIKLDTLRQVREWGNELCPHDAPYERFRILRRACALCWRNILQGGTDGS